MKKFFLPIILLFCSTIFSTNLFAAYGYFADCASSIIIGGTSYDVAPCIGSPLLSIDGVNFGTVTTLPITYLEQQTFEDSGDDVITGIWNFRAYTGAPSGAFIPYFLPITNLLGGGDEQRVGNPGFDLATGFGPGTYTAEFYFSSEVNLSGGGTDIIFDDNGGANYKFSFTIDAPAPVELSHFAATAKDDKVMLEWQTRTAINSSHFEIQKSSDGRNWETIGKQESEAAYSNDITNYSFIDHRPFSGKNYYRLNMVDLNGKEEFSEIVVMEWRKNNVVTFYPNPVKGQLNFTFSQKGISILKLYNNLGQLVASHRLTDDQEQSTFIQMDDLRAGFYIIQFYDQQGILINQDQFIKEE